MRECQEKNCVGDDRGLTEFLFEIAELDNFCENHLKNIRSITLLSLDYPSLEDVLFLSAYFLPE